MFYVLMVIVTSDYRLFHHKTHAIFDEALVFGYKQFIPVIIRPDFNDKVYLN